jgi:hypothetical protein
MLLSDNKKGLSTIIVKRVNGSESYENKPEHEGAEQDYSDGIRAASEEILSAIKSNDAKALQVALKSFMSMCEDED